MLKDKIKEALKTRAKNLGLDDSAFDGVAAFGETIVKEEAEIEGFVNSEATMTLLKTYQSVADKARASVKKNESKVTGPEPPASNPETKPDPAQQGNPADMAKIIEAVAAAIKPLSDELATFKADKAKETAVAALDKFVGEWDYAKGFPHEAAEAKRIALKLYAKGGETMTAEELIAEFRGEFDPAVKNKGVTDFSKPFESEGSGGNADEANKAFAEEIRKALGKEWGSASRTINRIIN